MESASINLSKLSKVVKNDIAKKIVFDKLVKKVNAIQTIDTSGLAKIPDFNR